MALLKELVSPLHDCISPEGEVGPRLGYGTALMAKTPLLEPASVSFPPSFPTFTKGYVRAFVQWPDPEGRSVRVELVSLHLDFSRQSVRREQIASLAERFSSRKEALVLMGDFNEGWQAEGSSVLRLVDELGLRAFEPEIEKVTFPRMGTRLDWILVSKDLRFDSHRVSPDPVSDHRAVVADIVWASLDKAEGP